MSQAVNKPLSEWRFLLRDIGTRKSLTLFATVCLLSLMDLASIAIIFPFLQVVTQPGSAGSLFLKLGPGVAGAAASVSHAQLCVVLGSVLALFFAVKTVLQTLLMKLQARVLARFTADLTNDLVSRILNARYAVFQETPVSQIAGTAYSNTVHASLTLNALMQMVNEGLLLGLLLLGFFLFQPVLALATLSVAGAAGLVLFLTVVRRSSRLGAAQTHIENVRYRLLFSIAYAIRDIKIMGLAPLFIARNDKVSRDYEELAWRYNLNNALPRLLIEVFAFFAVVGASLIIVLLQVPLVQAGPLLGVGAIAALRVAPGLAKLLNSLNQFKFSKSFVTRLMDLEQMLLGAAVRRREDRLTFERSIEMKDVGFRYGDRYILRDVSLELKRCQSIGIVGTSGAGKTTLLDLFTGLQQATEGEFLCDGVRFDPFTSKSIQGFIGYVPQSITLLDDTIAFNVSFQEHPDEVRIARALSIANLDGFIRSLPDGIRTEVGENGLRLSGGQRQRIGIARALYRDPKILVFDEATSSLDTLTEAELTAEIEKLRSGMSVVVVAHRLSTVMNCDRIYVLSDGRIECSGTHEELLTRSKTYEKLYARQQGEEQNDSIEMIPEI